jgi:glycosyltransferase involved in cell wall biosynthesis
MDDPTVSIVVNNYNYGRFLRAAIDSALAQTYPRVEVIVVDDGSTDESRSIVAGYGKRVVPVLKENGGQGSAANAGFAASRGDIVIFLDSDDTLTPEAAERVAEVFKPGVVRVQYPLTMMDADGRSLGVQTPIAALPRERILELLLRGIIVERAPTSGNAFSREFLEQSLPMPEAEWRRSVDAYLYIVAAFRGKLVTLSRPLGFYRTHSENSLAATRFDLTRLRDALRGVEVQMRLVRRLAGEHGLAVRKDWMLWNPSYVVDHLASLKLEPGQHPYPGEKVPGLALQGIRASLAHPLFTLRKRIFYAAFFAAAPVLPGSAVRRMMNAKRKVTLERRFSRLLGTGRAVTTA